MSSLTVTQTGGREATEGLIEGEVALAVGMPSSPAPEGWKWTKLTELARLETGHTPSRRRPEYWDGDIPWIGIRDATADHGRTLPDTNQHVTQEGIDNSSARILPAHTVCLSRTASVGYVVVMGREMATSQDFVNWVCDASKLDYRFLKYVLLAENRSLSRFSHGTTHQTIYFPEVKAFHICAPPISEQRVIADVLSALDEKIEQNRRAGWKLEGLARAVFKAWFVDFEPVKAKAAGATHFPGMPAATFAALPTRLTDSPLGPVPEEWENYLHRVSELEQTGTLLIGDGYRAKRSELADTGAPFIRAGNVNGSIITDGAELLGRPAVAKAGVKRSEVWDTVFTSKGTVGRIGLVTPSTGDVVYAPQVCFWRALDHDRLSPFLLHLWMKSESFTCQWMAVKGQTDMADFVSLSDQRAMTMFVPPREAQRGFDGIVRPIVELMAVTAAESAKLATLRDYLLPRLLSGRVRVVGAASRAELADHDRADDDRGAAHAHDARTASARFGAET